MLKCAGKNRGLILHSFKLTKQTHAFPVLSQYVTTLEHLGGACHTLMPKTWLGM